jgi:dienelactone hydrolase
LGVILLALQSLAHSQIIQPGKIATAVACAAPQTCSYAVYLPTTYDPQRPSPALFMFDPVARGATAIESARAAAEAHGVVLVASNDSRNGPMKASLEAGDAMWRDAHRRINIDPQRTYAAGFSGGGRVALLYAMLCFKCISVVIASGAGFPSVRPPSKDVDFAVFLTAGDLDFNYSEIVSLSEELKRLQIPSRTYVFHGQHDWPPEEGWRQAFSWIELGEAKKRPGPKNPTSVEGTLALFNAYAARLESEGDYVNAFRAYQSNIADFDGLSHNEAATSAVKRLQTAKPYLEQRKREKEAFSREKSIAAETTRQLADITGRTEQSGESLRDLRDRMSSLRKEADKGANADQIVVRRMLGAVLIAAMETADRMLRDGRYDVSLDLYRAVADFARKPAGAHFGMARVYAKQGKSKEALSAARMAFEHGATADDFRSVPEFSALLDRPEWQQLFAASPK